MNAILFPGQGSQIVGMGSEFYNKFEIVKKIFKEADEKLNFKISKLNRTNVYLLINKSINLNNLFVYKIVVTIWTFGTILFK